MKKLFKCLLVALLISPAICRAQQLSIIPYPQQVERLNGYHAFTGNGVTTSNKSLAKTLVYINGQLGHYSLDNKNQKEIIALSIKPLKGLRADAYQLSITKKRISIIAPDTTGIRNGLVTLLQICLFSKTNGGIHYLPNLTIRDQPRYLWRGMLLDESRHFFGKRAVEQLLDWMTFYKLNKFHWHLTDSQGWRIAIDKYPLLSTEGGKGNFSDSLATPCYYTKSEIREIVKYAAERNITIIPEIDMPGHATAATRAYPYLSGGIAPNYPNFTFDPSNPKTYDFLNAVISEVYSLFPGKMIHIGGDEVALGITAWKNNPGVSRLMADKKLNDLNAVESYFLNQIADSVIKRNNDVLCWDEAVKADLPVNNTIIEWWRQNKPETLKQALEKGYRVVLCPRLPLYLDFVQDSTHISGRKWGEKYNSYLDIYHFPENLMTDSVIKTKSILGIQANLWTETVVTTKRMQFLLFPRMVSVAEAGWSEPESKNELLYNKRLLAHFQLYKMNSIYYYDPFEPGIHNEPVDLLPVDKE